MDNGAFIEADGWTVEIFRGFQPHNSRMPLLNGFLAFSCFNQPTFSFSVQTDNVSGN